MVLKTGVSLLVMSSAGVLYRSAELAYSSIPCLKWLCLGGLSISLLCFAVVYVRFEAPRFRRVISPESDMIKSPMWKSSSMA
jgi:hypothetical protein